MQITRSRPIFVFDVMNHHEPLIHVFFLPSAQSCGEMFREIQITPYIECKHNYKMQLKLPTAAKVTFFF